MHRGIQQKILQNGFDHYNRIEASQPIFQFPKTSITLARLHHVATFSSLPSPNNLFLLLSCHFQILQRHILLLRSAFLFLATKEVEYSITDNSVFITVEG